MGSIKTEKDMKSEISAKTQLEHTICLFPQISNTEATNTDIETVNFDPCVLRALSNSVIELRWLLPTAWAIVLSRFVGTDVVRFGVDIDPETGKGTGTLGRQVYSATIVPDATACSLFGTGSWEISALNQNKSDIFNTGVFIQQGGSDKSRLYNINILAQLGGHKPTLNLVYRRRCLSRFYAKLLVNAVCQATQCILEDPSRKLGRISLFCPAQKQQIVSWQSQKPKAPAQLAMFKLLEGHALRQPSTQAVESFDGTLTYAQLDELSSRLAVYLQDQHGVGSGTMVMLCTDKSRMAIVALFAINKAGGCFVPCDPDHPVSRRQAIATICQSKIAIVSPQYENAFSGIVSDVIVLSAATVGALIPDKQQRTFYCHPTAPAYCFFTSGSTGEPKGCLGQHTALASVANQVQALHLTSDSRVLQFAKLGFGISFIEIFCTAAAGGTVCMPSDYERMNALPDAINRMRVNWVLLTPTVVESLQLQNLPTIEKVFLGGEPPGEAQILDWISKVSLFQVYGTTEMAGVTSVSQQITSPQARKVIGFPSDSRLWLVDPTNHDQLAPIGAIAELIIEGPALAEGYLADPERTNASFLAEPAWLADVSPESTWMYKTGDLVRYNEDGSLSIVGRKGTQVKLRGQRLELEDVECHLTRLLRDTQTLSETRRVVATVLEQQPGQADRRTLAALILVPQKSSPGGGLHFIDMDNQRLSELDDVQQRLRSRLPAFMVPQLLLTIAGLPRLPTGKVDRRTLQRQLSTIPYEELRRLAGLKVMNQEPQTDFERAIQALICKVLHIEADKVGMRDNFFHLGGNSMTAMKMTAAAKRQSLRLTVADIFEHPVLVDLASAISRITASHNSLTVKPFALVNGFQSSADVQQTVASQLNIDPSLIQDAYPCTPLQEGLIALTEKRPSSYRARVFCCIKPEAEVGLLKAAWESVVENNDILRTRIVSMPSQEMLQVVIREPFQWDVGEDRESYLAQADQAPMGLGTRLVQGCILTEDGGPALILTIHHVLCDQWSIRLLLDQLQSVYSGGSSPGQKMFSPFIKYVNDRLHDSDTYWKSRFDNLEAQIFPQLPRPDFPVVTDAELQYQVCVPPRIAGNYTVSSYIRLAWALVISHNTAVNDVVFGETLSGRGADVNNDDIEQIVGPAIATVPQRFQLDLEKSVAHTLDQIQDQCSRMVPHEQVGLQNIRRISREADIGSMFQSHLVIQPACNRSWDLFREVHAGSSAMGGFSSYALSIECCLSENENQLDMRADLDTRIMSRARVERLLQHFDSVLQTLVQEPYQPLGNVPGVTSGDLDQIYTWNAVVPDTLQETIHGAFRQQVNKSPSATAVASWDGNFTYAELEHRSNQVAMELLSHNVQPDTFIPVLFEKSKWTTVAMLGVNKAGGAFVLMDPAQPLQRLCTLGKEAQCTIILCSNLTSGLARKIASPIIIGEQAAKIWNHDVDIEQLPQVRPQDAAYAMFTSGSTGTPKGTIVEHGSYCTGARDFSSSLLTDSRSRMLQFASYSFDCCIGETMSTLMVGGCVCVPLEEDRHNALARAMSDFQVTNAMLTPSVARLFRHEDVPSLRVLSLMGEAMRPADYSYWSERLQLINGYGPTECSVGISYQPYKAGVHVRDIGRPRAAVAWITDPRDHNSLMPVGAVGELLLEGPPVARGYMNNPEQTAQSFITAPAWARSIRRSHRIYKTGDLVHYNEDGSLRFIGRANDQMKLRGQRLERGEVETQLRECWGRDLGLTEPGEVAVDAVVPQGNQDRVCLAAFIVVQGTREDIDHSPSHSLWVTPDEGFSRRAAQAESRLQQHLPHFMVPSIFVPLSHMPRMASGKIDRPLLTRGIQAYPWEELRKFYPAAAPTRFPSTAEEHLLQEIWAQVLGISATNIGIDDNFFRLGGDSIAGMQTVVQARAQKLDHSVADIFHYKTIAAIIEHIMSGNRGNIRTLADKEDSTVLPDFNQVATETEESLKPSYTVTKEVLAEAGILTEDVEDVYPCAPIQRGILLVQARKPEFYHVAFSWEIFNASLERIESAVKQVIARHAIFRTCFLESEPSNASLIQVVRRHGQHDIPVRPITELGKFPGKFQPNARCPSRFTIYHSGTSSYVRLDISHAVWDGITSLVVERDLGLASHGRLFVNEPPRFRNYISYIEDQNQAAAAGFWKAHLEQFEPCYLPSLTPQAHYGPDISQSLRFELDRHSEIGPYCRQNHVTAPNIFCMAWALVLQCLTGMDNVCFGNIVSGRDLPLHGVSEMAGPLINLLPFHVNLKEGNIFKVLREVYKDYAASLSHQTFCIADLPHHTKRSPMSLFNTQLSIRRHVPEPEGDQPTRLLSIESPDPQEFRINVYVIIEEHRTRVEMTYWKSTMSTEQASLIQECFNEAVSQILVNDQASAANINLLKQEQKDLIWGPLSTQERCMQKIWADVLGLPRQRIGPNDDFFSLGGDSMAAMKVIASASKEGIKIRLADIFASSTLGVLVRESR